ncbi:unnamed protein product [Somion occarium]|uniref:DRBM domain-containing protein n=1 Tax=Somion occarium TaxID=3059160 RepID=A0ABP1CF75_9APHY
MGECPCPEMPSNDGTVALNNYLQSQNELQLLVCQEVSSGPSHSPEWTVTYKMHDQVLGVGTGATKALAKDAAAKAALQTLRPSGA